MIGQEEHARSCKRSDILFIEREYGESTSTASQLTSSASQKSKDLNKVSLLLQDLGFSPNDIRSIYN